MRLLHLDSSARFERSSSRALSAHFVGALKARPPDIAVDRIDVAAEPLPHVSEMFTAAAYAPEQERTAEMRDVLRVSDGLVDRLPAADSMVFGVPMYNFGMPSSFKAFVDHIVRGGRTYVSGRNIPSLASWLAGGRCSSRPGVPTSAGVRVGRAKTR